MLLSSLGSLTIAENQPVGTMVGEFNATDPDAGADPDLLSGLGAGDGNNSLFTMNANGILQTATTFDYETNSLNLLHPGTGQGRVQCLR